MTGRKLMLAVVFALASTLVLGAGPCARSATQAELQKAQDAQKKAEIELAKTQQELADVKAELAELKAKDTSGATKDGESGTSTDSGQTSGVWTPGTGSTIRKAILDAVRAKIGWKNLFVVQTLRVKDGWAYAVLRPYDPAKPGQRYEEFTVLARKTGGWTVLWTGDGSEVTNVEETNNTSIEKWFQKKYGAPADLFS